MLAHSGQFVKVGADPRVVAGGRPVGDTGLGLKLTGVGSFPGRVVAAREVFFRAGRRTLLRTRALTSANAVVALTMLVFLVPALIDISSGERRAYGYLAPDAFYYFTVGVNWARLGFPTFDQHYPTNGFHPLWQWVIAALYRLCSALGYSRFALAPGAVVLGLFCLAGALVFFGRVLARQRQLSPFFVLLPVGAFSAAISGFWWSTPSEDLPLFGTMWGFANGLESALAILLYSWVAWLFVTRPMLTRARAALFGSALGLFTLARLDHGIFAVIFLAALALEARRRRSALRLRLSGIIALTFVAWLGAYLLYNRLSAGLFIPVSGAVKSTFPRITNTNFEAIAAFRTVGSRVRLYQLGRLGSLGASVFGALLFVPFALRWECRDGRYALCLRDEGRGRLNQFLLCTAIGTLILAAYNLLFVINWHIGQWYMPVSVVFLSLFAMELADRVRASSRARSASLVGIIAALGLAAGTLVYFWRFQRVPGWGAMYADFCLEQGPRAGDHYGTTPPAFISDDDGVVAFGTGYPATSGTLLAIDAEAESAWRQGRFQELVLQRGIEHVALLNPAYVNETSGHVGERSEALRAPVTKILHGDLTSYDVEVEYSDGAFAMLRLVPHESASNPP